MQPPPLGAGHAVYQPRYLPSQDVTEFAWRGLRRFHNSDVMASNVIKVLKIDPKHKDNVKKQMLQLRYCLMQAREYFEAAEVASLSTKAVQLYYCCMSLALAQILWKMDGNSSLDKLREEHRHHGLDLAFPSKIASDLATAAGEMVARQMGGPGKRKGTFSIWHRCVRQLSTVGFSRRYLLEGGSQTRLEVLMNARDIPIPELPAGGVSLLQCIRHIPSIIGHISTLGIMTNLVRASIEREVHEEADGDPLVAYSLTVQPGLKDRIEEIRKDIYFDANGVDKVELVEFPSGFSVTWRFKASMRFGAILPEGFPTTPTEYQLVGHDPYLNEFGYLYVGLYICGMLSRYYPDFGKKR
jgi:hypothetical protein